MKIGAKVFIWIGMVLGCIAIVPLVVGIFALRKLDEAETTKELLVISILTLIFCSAIAGVLMLCMSDKDLIDSSASTQKSKTNTKIFAKKICTTIGLCLITISTLVLSIFMLCYDLTINTAGITNFGLCSILGLLIALLLVCTLIVYLKHSQTFSKVGFGLLITILILQVLLFACFVALEFFVNIDSVWVKPSIVSVLLWLPILLLMLAVFLWNWLTRKEVEEVVETKVIAKKSKEKTSMQIELEEAQRLLKEKVVTQEEYEKIRQTIISKYYK